MLRLEGGRLAFGLEENLPDFQFAFEGSSEDGFGTYYHTHRTHQLTARFGDVLHKVRDLEVRSRAGGHAFESVDLVGWSGRGCRMGGQLDGE